MVKNRALLPRGFSDQLPPEADREAAAIAALGQLFSAFGYKRIKPPLVEFEDTLFAPGPGASLPHEAFRILDPDSYKMMGVRSDITPQIARIAATRLSDMKRPLRLTYANDVLRTTANQHRTARQFCKVGCEIIGSASIEADHELCILAIMGLKKLGVAHITLDLSLPRLIGYLFTPEELTPALKDAIDNRDAGRIQDLLDYGSRSAFIVSLVQNSGDRNQIMSLLKDNLVDENALQDIQNLETLINNLVKACTDLQFDDVTITVDPLESKGFEYHRGIAFSLFAGNVNGEVGRGGRYTIPGNSSDNLVEQACGFTLYMDTVSKAMPTGQIVEKSYKTVSPTTSWTELKKMVENGENVVRDIKD